MAFKNIVTNGIASKPHQQTKNDLRVLVFSIFAEACLSKVIFITGFEIKRRLLIKHNADLTAHNLYVQMKSAQPVLSMGH